MEIDNMIIHYKPQYKFLPIEINFRHGNKIVSRAARKDLAALQAWLIETDLYKLPYKIIIHHEYEMGSN